MRKPRSVADGVEELKEDGVLGVRGQEAWQGQSSRALLRVCLQSPESCGMI